MEEKTALLVIDMINDFIEQESCALFCSEGKEVEWKIAQLVDFFHQHLQHIIFINDEHREDDQDFLIRPVHALKGTWGAELVTSLKEKVEEADYVIKKRRLSAFAYTDLDLFLREEGIKNLVLVGVFTDTGVRSTASDGYYHGYRVTTIEDCCCSQTQESHKNGLSDIKMFGQVVTLAEFLAQHSSR